MYDFLLSLHLLAVVIWVGGGTILHVLGRRALATGDPRSIVEFGRDAAWFGPRLFAPLAIILFVAGQGLVAELDLEHTTWIILAETGWLIAFLIGIVFYGRQAKKLEAIVAARGMEDPAAVENVRRTVNVASVEILILLLVVVDMAVKPGL